MRLLFVHADHLEFEVTTEADEGIAETEGVPMSGRVDDCVAAFVSVERADEADLDAVVENAAGELRDVAGQLDTREVVLYPYAHLSEDLAAPDSAKTVLRDLETALKGDFEILRAPFGWYASFELACKGHPFSERSRRVTPERTDGEAGDDRAPSEWLLAFPDGETLKLNGETADPLAAKDADRVSEDMRAFVESEVEAQAADERANEELPHVELVREKGLADYDEPCRADALRWYPRGKLIRDSVMAWADDLVGECGGMPVGVPDVYDLLHDVRLSASDLPLRLHESSTDPLRREKTDGVLGPEHQRGTTTPAMHTATRDMARARAELERQARLALRAGEDLGLDYEPAIRLTREFYEDDEEWVESLAADLGKPALLEILPEHHSRRTAKVDFAAIDGLGHPIQNLTVQLDIESAERFGVTYNDGDQTYHPPILHFSPSAGIEHVVAALLESAARREIPRLPTWLSPTQVRFVPVGEEHVERCDSLVADLESAGVRADVDDREETVGERIARAESDWVPYYSVVGDRELERDDGALAVNVRAEADQRETTVEELRATVCDDVGDLPTKRRYLPRHVSRHPQFTG